ncbi:MAG: ORF6N domain-containing protein [Candidatus Paceibacterota bacterium]
MKKLKIKLKKKQNLNRQGLVKTQLITIPSERVISKIFLIREKKVMIDKDLAELYGVETKVLNQAVKRNPERFPTDFMFQLNKQETEIWISQIVIPASKYQINNLNLRSQFVTSSWGGRRYSPMVFTEEGVAMLSSVLNSKRAIQTNIQIIRTFTKLREMLITNKELREKIEKLEKRYDQNFRIIFQAIQSFLKNERKPKSKIGF